MRHQLTSSCTGGTFLQGVDHNLGSVLEGAGLPGRVPSLYLEGWMYFDAG
jgi:hypothetical protein